jgi:uracil-DNA glycosylase family protein
VSSRGTWPGFCFTSGMAARKQEPGAEAFLPEKRQLPALRAASAACQGCSLYVHATQTVFGEGRADARIVFVGEQPGDKEDRAGRPFVGPAGRVFDQALAEIGLARSETYVTNAVKHFKFQERGKARLHKRPAANEIRACRPWLMAELALIRPRALVLLGATAAQAVLGPSFRVTQDRGRPVPSELAPIVVATVHPASILRSADDAERERAFASFVEDLRGVKRLLDDE